MATINPPESIFDLPTSLIAQMISLATSGFGVVVALAWNEVIKSTIETYVKPHLGQGSGVISLFIYAIVVTVLAVLVTMQLSLIQRTVEKIPKRRGKKTKKAKVKTVKATKPGKTVKKSRIKRVKRVGK